MVQLNFHNQMPFNPPPTVVLKQKEAYQYWLALYNNLPKTERFGIG